MAEPVTYVEPGVTVEIVEQVSGYVPPAGKLPPCIVGPGFQLVVRGFAGTHDGSDATEFSYPSQLDYSTVDTESVEVYITNAVDGVTYEIPETTGVVTNWTATEDSVTLNSSIYAVIGTGTSGIIAVADLDTFDISTSLTGITIYADDVLYISTAGTYQGEYDIAGKDSNGDLVMQDPFTGLGATGLSWEIRRYLLGNVYLSFRALRGDLVENRTWYDDTNAVLTGAGGTAAITPDNPLFYGAYICTTAGSGTWVCGVDDMYASDDYTLATTIKWSEAFDYLQDFQDMYSFVIMTQNAQIIALSQTFVDWMSLPVNKAESVAFCSPHRTTEEEAINTATATARGDAAFAADGSTFTVAQIDGATYSFVTYGCTPMGYIEVTYNDTVYEIRTKKVEGALVTILDTSVIPAAIMGAASSSTALGWTWRYINDYYDSAAEAQYYREYGASIADKRVRLSFPATVGVSISGVTTAIPSFY